MTREEQQEAREFQRDISALLLLIDSTLASTQAVIERTADVMGIEPKDFSREKVEAAGIKINEVFKELDNFEMLVIVCAHYSALLKTLAAALTKRLPIN